MNREEALENLRQRLSEPPPQPMEAATDFLNIYFFDDSVEEAYEHIKQMVEINPRTVIQGLIGIELLLANPLQEEKTFLYLVEIEANRSLNDPTGRLAIQWLREVAGKVREILGDKVPPQPI